MNKGYIIRRGQSRATHIPMESRIKAILNIAVVIIVILWLLQGLGVLGPLGDIKVR